MRIRIIMPFRRRSLVLAPLFIGLCSLAGGLLGPGLTRVAAAAPEDDVKGSIKAFTRVYQAVEENSADKPSADRAIYKGAIPGMLRTLDPHSNFFDPKDFNALRDD